jgi:hypothetical protein
MATQEPGWSSSPFASGIAPKDAWSRKIYGSIGGRTDDVFAYSDQEDSLMNRTLSNSFRSRGGSGGGGSDWLGSGSVNMKFGGGNTPSNPGAYNYNTLNNTVGGAASTVNWAFNTRSKLRANQEKQDRIKTLKDARDQKAQTAQKKQNLNTFASKTIKQGRALQASNFASRTKFKRGSASSAPATTINLLDSKAPGGFPASYFNKQTPPQTP